jgi:hypothetical protein
VGLARDLAAELKSWIGGWAEAVPIADALLGPVQPESLPKGMVGDELRQLIPWLRRSTEMQPGDVRRLGKLLGVDYVLVIGVDGERLNARLFSVRQGKFSPQAHVATLEQRGTLQRYVRTQLAPQREEKSAWASFKKRWWIWAAAAGLAAVTIGVALGTDSGDRSGALRVRVYR